MANVATKSAEIQGLMRKFSAQWARVQPKLQQNPTVPVSYVIDTVDALINGIGNPVADIEIAITNQLQIMGGFSFGSLLGGGSNSISESLLAQIRSATADAASTMRFLINGRLIPLKNEALAARASGAKNMKIPVAGSSEIFRDPFDQTVLATMQHGASALQALTGIQEALNNSVVGAFAGKVVDGCEAVLGALTALANAIATIGAGAYELFKTLVTVAKIALLGAVGYVGYTFYTEARGHQRALPAPTQNPRRRRRRRRS